MWKAHPRDPFTDHSETAKSIDQLLANMGRRWDVEDFEMMEQMGGLSGDDNEDDEEDYEYNRMVYDEDPNDI